MQDNIEYIQDYDLDIENEYINTAAINTINNKNKNNNLQRLNNNNNDNDNNINNYDYFLFYLLLVFTLIWFITGIAAWITSILCFIDKKNKIENIVGFFIAMFLGPFYWLYFIYMDKYCSI